MAHGVVRKMIFPREVRKIRFLFPKKRQWQRWSAPSKLTYVGTCAGLLSLFVTLVTLFFGAEGKVSLTSYETYDPSRELMFIGAIEFDEHLKDRNVPRKEFAPFVREDFGSVVRLLSGCYVVHETEATMIAGFAADFFPHGGFLRIYPLSSDGLSAQIAFKVEEMYDRLETGEAQVVGVTDPFNWPLLTDQDRGLGMVIEDQIGLFAEIDSDILTVEGKFNDGSPSWVRFYKIQCP